MLRVQSFDIGDDKGMNELLSTHLIASEAHILVSDGKVCIPYEDGEQESTAQKKTRLQEEVNRRKRELDVVDRSQRVIINKIKGAQEQLTTVINDLKEAESGNNKEAYDNKKELKEEQKRLENVIAQYEVNLVQNQAEITNKHEEIKVYEEDVKELA